MPDHIPSESEHHIPFTNDASIIPNAAEIAAREEAERHRRQDSDHQLVLDLEERQAEAQEVQAKSNTKIAALTAAIVIVSFISGGVSYLQFIAANKSANAAKSAAETAAQTLNEMRKGSADTHDLAVAAQEQAKAAVIQSRNTEAVTKTTQDQLAITRSQLLIAKDTFEAANRPYLGTTQIFAMHTVHIGPEGAEYTLPHPTPETVGMNIRVVVKNFGTVPARRSVIDWRHFLDEVELVDKVGLGNKIPDKPKTIFPTATVSLSGVTKGRTYSDIARSGTARLAITVSYTYDGPTGIHYSDCEKFQYEPTQGLFADLGECPQSQR